MLSRCGQSQRPQYCMIPLTWNFQNRQIYGSRKQLSDNLGWTGLWENGEWLLMVWRFRGRWWKCYKVDFDDGCTTLNILETTELYILNEWIIWHVYYILIKLFLKTLSYHFIWIGCITFYCNFLERTVVLTKFLYLFTISCLWKQKAI